MSTKDMLALSVLLVVTLLLFNCYSFQISQEKMLPAGLPNLHFSKRLKKEMIRSEICIGRRCAGPYQQEDKNNVEFFITLVVLSLIGLAIHLTVRHERERTTAEAFMRTTHGKSATSAKAFKCTAHSTSIAGSSLSPSPVPRTKRSPVKNRTGRRLESCKIPWDRMADSSNFDVCLSLHPSPLNSDGSCDRSFYSSINSSSSSCGLYPCAPPRRWRGNSRLNLATSPEVVPKEVDQYYRL